MVAWIIDYSARNRFVVFLLLFGLAAAGLWALKNTPIDAVPDISDTRVIIYTTWMGRSPDLVKDGTDIYWARSRVLEYMNQLACRLPEGVTPQLGPDTTAVGWIFQYALIDERGEHDLAALRSFQDWSLRYWLRSVDGVAEVASVGGFVRQYQVSLDPTKLLAYNLALPEVIEKIRMSNNDMGGRVVEFAGAEYMIRGRGYIKSVADIAQIAVGVNQNGTPTCSATLPPYGWDRTCGGG
jgi:copper/silver efflux system protein